MNVSDGPPRAREAPCFVPGQCLLYLPASAEAWDVEIDDRARTLLSIRPGWYRLDFAALRRARMLRDTRWLRVRETAVPPTESDLLTLALPEEPALTPVVATATPDAQYLAGEELLLQMLPATAGFHELCIKRVGESPEACGNDEVSNAGEQRRIVQGNRQRFKRGLEPGQYVIRTRWVPDVADWQRDAAQWTRWSKPLRLTVWRKRDAAEALRARVAEHRLSLMAGLRCQRGVHGDRSVGVAAELSGRRGHTVVPDAVL